MNQEDNPQNSLSHTKNPDSVVMPWMYPASYVIEEEINLLDYWRVLQKRKWQIILVTLLCMVLAFAVTRMMPEKYKTEVTLMPLSSSGGGGLLSGLSSQLGALSSLGILGDMGKLGGGKSKELVNILKSRRLTAEVIQKFDLMKVFFAKQYDPTTNSYHKTFLKSVPVLEDAVNVFMKKYSKIEEDKKTGLIKIELTMKDPKLAAQVANYMVIELQNFIENNSLTIAKRNRTFIEEQLVKNRVKLLEAGKELNQFYSENKISSVVPLLDVNAGSYQTTPKTFEDFRREFESLEQRRQEAEEKKQQASVQKVPGQVYLQYLTLNREILVQAYTLLTQQYELAKIEEAKEDLAFQILDKAEVKVRPSSPSLVINMAIGTMGGFFLAVFLAFFREYISKLKVKELKN